MTHKSKNLFNVRLLNMRHTRHRPKPENIFILFISVVVESSSIYISLNDISKRNRDIFLIYSIEKRESILLIDLRVSLTL